MWATEISTNCPLVGLPAGSCGTVQAVFVSVAGVYDVLFDPNQTPRVAYQPDLTLLPPMRQAVAVYSAYESHEEYTMTEQEARNWVRATIEAVGGPLTFAATYGFTDAYINDVAHGTPELADRLLAVVGIEEPIGTQQIADGET